MKFRLKMLSTSNIVCLWAYCVVCISQYMCVYSLHCTMYMLIAIAVAAAVALAWLRTKNSNERLTTVVCAWLCVRVCFLARKHTLTTTELIHRARFNCGEKQLKCVYLLCWYVRFVCTFCWWMREKKQNEIIVSHDAVENFRIRANVNVIKIMSKVMFLHN